MADHSQLDSSEASTSASQSHLMSINELCNSTSATTINDPPEQENYEHKAVDQHDPDVQSAAEALGDMARTSASYRDNVNLPPLSLPTSSASSTTNTTPLTTPTSTSSSNPMNFTGTPNDNTHFISRLATIPVFQSTLRAYERTKATSRVVQYGANVVESSVKTIAAPLYDKLGVDEWGNRQLDKLERAYPAIVETRPECEERLESSNAAQEMKRRRQNSEGVSEEYTSSHSRNRTRSASRSTSPHRHTLSYSPYGSSSITAVLAPRSRWHQLMVGASTAAGTTAAVVSEESMKCLRYCLSWLQYAVQHIDQQIAILRNFLISLATNAMHNNASAPNSDRALVPAGASSRINEIKKEVVNTLRKVVEVVSKYAGACLPDQAKLSVRGFILSLPGKWASLQNEHSTTPSPMSSPSLGPTSPALSATAGHPYHVQDNAQKILTLAGESVDMLRSVGHIFFDTIERAEGWLDRLRYVGVPGVPDRSARNDDTTLPPLRQSGRSSRTLPPLNSLAKGGVPRFMTTTVSSDEDLEIEDRDSDDEATPSQRMGEFAVPRRRVRKEEADVEMEY
ncbi:transcription factor Opi1-domain-containing protein [Jimgerdemannia flammicorona]|uniref:Transcription factor Opi1-domain-containing protein n=1 Tax=Jimgerdemannia flammicorona TaxID=994334 RepID=A0A433Q0L6_9FUNG|nr:transcription factor Opi1-domain-containing protein [Jimgerdemannia flammicorona]